MAAEGTKQAAGVTRPFGGQECDQAVRIGDQAGRKRVGGRCVARTRAVQWARRSIESEGKKQQAVCIKCIKHHSSGSLRIALVGWTIYILTMVRTHPGRPAYS